MMKGWKGVALVAALFSSAVAMPLAYSAHAAAKAAAPAKAKARTALHQFTGVVTSVDKNSLTVEKKGKTPRTIQFVKHSEMTATGEIEKQTRVTVYYRDEDGHPTAHKVVVRTPVAR